MNKYLISCLMFTLYAVGSTCKVVSKAATINLSLSISEQKLKSLITKKQFSLEEIKDIFIANFKEWSTEHEQAGITCQSVTPMGKWIGEAKNPNYKNKKIAGGQSENCNFWIIKKVENKQSK